MATWGAHYMAYSVLGGAAVPAEIRYVNVGQLWSATIGRTVHLDFVATARSAYAPANSSLNGLNGRFARVSVASGTSVELRLTIVASCAQEASCQRCEDGELTEVQKSACYAAGCACFGDSVTSASGCAGARYEESRATYGCAQMNQTVTLPVQSSISFTAYDFDGGADGGCLEQLTMHTPYEYKKTPLRPSSDNHIGAKVQQQSNGTKVSGNTVSPRLASASCRLQPEHCCGILLGSS